MMRPPKTDLPEMIWPFAHENDAALETDSPEMIRPFVPEMMRPPETDSPEKDLAANKNLPVITNRSSKTTTRAKRFRLMGATRVSFSGCRIIFGRIRLCHIGQISFRRPHHFRAQKAVLFRAPFICWVVEKKTGPVCRKNSRDFVLFSGKKAY